MTEKDLANTFAENLERMLIDRGMSQKDLAQASHLTQASISRYLSRKRTISMPALMNICVALKCRPKDLLPFDGYID